MRLRMTHFVSYGDALLGCGEGTHNHTYSRIFIHIHTAVNMYAALGCGEGTHIHTYSRIFIHIHTAKTGYAGAAKGQGPAPPLGQRKCVSV